MTEFLDQLHFCYRMSQGLPFGRLTQKTMDVALFSATAAAVLGRLYYQRLPCRRAKTTRHVSFRLSQGKGARPDILQTLLPSQKQLSTTFAPMIGLLFAASWCPDCWETVPAIAKVIEAQEDPQLLAAIYISSDSTAEEALQFKPSSFHHVPFANVEERSNLKRKFRTCAKKEMKDVGVTERKNGIPTFILLETATGRILTEDGVNDVMNGTSPESTFEKWRGLLPAV